MTNDSFFFEPQERQQSIVRAKSWVTFDVYFGLSPLPVRVTTRIITFLVGNPYKPSFPLLLGGGTTQRILILLMNFCHHLGWEFPPCNSVEGQLASQNYWANKPMDPGSMGRRVYSLIRMVDLYGKCR